MKRDKAVKNHVVLGRWEVGIGSKLRDLESRRQESNRLGKMIGSREKRNGNMTEKKRGILLMHINCVLPIFRQTPICLGILQIRSVYSSSVNPETPSQMYPEVFFMVRLNLTKLTNKINP